jgi:hypothetical protein
MYFGHKIRTNYGEIIQVNRSDDYKSIKRCNFQELPLCLHYVAKLTQQVENTMPEWRDLHTKTRLSLSSNDKYILQNQEKHQSL